MPDLPDKLFFRIGEVATIVGVEPHVLRYWETEFQSIRPEKSRRGQRVYSRKDVEALQRVRDLLYTHRYTIAGAKKRLRTRGVEPRDLTDPTTARFDQMRGLLTGVRDELAELRAQIAGDLAPAGPNTGVTTP